MWKDLVSKFIKYCINRYGLEELEIGDDIYFKYEKKEYKYTVLEKLYEKPDKTWVLNGNGKDSEITLD